MFTFSAAPADAAYRITRLAPASLAHNRVARLLRVPLLLNGVDFSGLDVLHLHGDDWFYMHRTLPTVRTFHGSAQHEARSATSTRRRAAQYATFGLEILASRLATRSYTLIDGADRIYRPAGALPNAVQPGPDPRPDRHGAPTILFVGTWEGRKRGKLLYDAFCRYVVPAIANAELHMVTDSGPDHLHPRVKLYDRPTDGVVADLYQRAWVFCLPSRYEGFGLPYAEAMACATPVVATHNPGAGHILDGGRAGVLSTEENLGPTLVRVLSDDDLRARLAIAGRLRAETFSWDRVLDAHEAAYETAIRAWHSFGPSRRGRRASGRLARAQP